MNHYKIDEVLCSSFDQLLESLFTGDQLYQPGLDQNSFQCLGDYIEIYKEKKALESHKKNLTEMIKNKNRMIQHLKKQIEVSKQNSDKNYEEMKRLTEAHNDQRRFLAQLSHEIRTPMNGVLGMTDILTKTNLSDEQREYVEIIKMSSNSMLTLVNDILDYSRLNAGAVALNRSEFNLHRVLDEAREILAYQAQEKKLEFTVQIDPDVAILLKGDAQRLKQILLNLMGNALKFTDSGTVTISVRVESENDNRQTICFRVKDTGIGISAKQQKRLFKPFAQADGSISKKYGGTGLGLVICKELVDMMKGRIGFVSEPEKGSEFWFTIEYETCDSLDPANVNPPVTETLSGDDSKPPPEQPAKPLQILLVEDDRINCIVCRTILKKLGHHTDTAENGNQALELLYKSQYDVVLMDIQMPEMDGWETSRRIRQFAPGSVNDNIPIIALTANASKGDEEKCLSAGMNGYLSKPLEIDQLVAKLKDICPPGTRTAKVESKAANMEPSYPTVHKDKLLQMKQDIEEKFEPIIQMFLQSLPQKVNEIQKIAASNDRQALQNIAHQLKGNCANFYAERLSKICHLLEQKSASGSMDTINRYIHHIDSESKKVQMELHAMIYN